MHVILHIHLLYKPTKYSFKKRQQAKCPPTFEMTVCGEYVYNMYVIKMPSEEMANSLPSPSQSPSPDQTQHGSF